MVETAYYHAINRCRVCQSGDLLPVLSLGEQYVTNFIDLPDEKTVRAPLEVVLCDAEKGGCGLLQLKHTTSHDLLYRQYWYKSGINQSMKDALADITQRAEHLIGLQAGDVVLDIGCNDGTLLRSYRARSVSLVGFEPAKNLVPEAQEGTVLVINDFFNAKAFERELPTKKAKVITAIAMFYDLDDPNAFVADVAKTLDREGVFIIQMNYLPTMLQRNVFDNISHEHLAYYSLLSLRYLLGNHNLEIFDVELNDVNGGSIRTYIRHKESAIPKGFEGATKRLRELQTQECNLGLHRRKVYEDFAGRIHTLREKTYRFIAQNVAKGKSVYVYGASTRGNTLLQFFGLDHKLLKAAAERNPMKWGKKMVGTLVPIISEVQAREEHPDYFLILPWQFLKEFRERERAYLMSGGKFIVPLPEFQVIT